MADSSLITKGKHGAHLIGKRGRPPKGIHLGVYTCNTTLAAIDKRSKEFRLMRQVRRDLTNHIGGKPNPAQRMLIERAAVLSLRVAQLDQKIIDGEIFTTMDNNSYIAWSNALVRTIGRLGIAPTDAPQPTLNDLLADIAARRAQPEDAA